MKYLEITRNIHRTHNGSHNILGTQEHNLQLLDKLKEAAQVKTNTLFLR